MLPKLIQPPEEGNLINIDVNFHVQYISVFIHAFNAP